MRKQLVLIVTVALVAGCAPGADEELRGLVEDAAPAESSMLECSWGTNWGSEPGV